MVAIQEKIITFERDTAEEREFVLKGSDSHLDLILAIKPKLDIFVAKIEEFNEGLIPLINTSTIDEIKAALPGLKNIYKNSRIIIAKLHKVGIYHDIKSSTGPLSNSSENLHEIIQDLEVFRLDEDAELNVMLENLND